jgi:two-component system sensor histidine kinase HydH
VSWIRAQDFAWFLFIVVLIVTAPDTSNQALILLPLLGAFQILEPRFRLFASQKGIVFSIVLKLIFCFLVVGWTHGIDSAYSMIFLIPVVSAATSFDLLGVIVVTGISCIAYFSFLLPVYLYYPNYDLPPGQLGIMSLRVAFYAIVAFLVYEQAHAKRDEMKRTEEAAARLAESNRNLQRAEASLRRSERLAALGQLTAGLAHELRNPLGTIKASAEMLTKETLRGRPEVMSEMAGYIGSEVDRMNGLVSSFLDFARPLQIHSALSDIKVVIEEVLHQRKEQADAAGVELSMQLDPSAPTEFVFDPELMKLALTNLVQNAIQASTRGQEVAVRVASRNEQVMIFVSDKGSGIQPQHLENIFNPFFTTKPQGTGLGLAIVSKIVDEHRGKINVFSEPGAGTTFEITLLKEQIA